MILVAGGAGYIGSHANKMLARRGHDTVVLDNFAYGHRDFVKWGALEEGDLGDPAFLDRVFKNHTIEGVMHFCAYTYVGESVKSPQKYYRNNVANTLNLLEAMLRHGVKKFIFSSTCATYGEPAALPITEDMPQNPINPYGKTKLMVEKILEDYAAAYGLRSCALRYFNAAGADPDGEIGEKHDPETHLIPLVLDAAAGRRKSICVFGTDYDTPDGTCLRDYIHVNDLADAHIRALGYLEDHEGFEAFNLGSGIGYSVKEILSMAETVTGKQIPATYAKRRAGDPPRLIGSAEKATSVLGWKPTHDLKSMIETAWRWHQSIPYQ